MSDDVRYLHGRAAQDEILSEQSATAAQQRADAAYRHALGVSAPARLAGESAPGYRVRLVSGVARFSERWKKVDRAGFAGLAAGGALHVAEEQVYADAVRSAKRSTGPLRKVTEVDPDTGLRITRFYGDPRGWLDQFSNPTRLVTGINRGSR